MALFCGNNTGMTSSQPELKRVAEKAVYVSIFLFFFSAFAFYPSGEILHYYCFNSPTDIKK